MVLCSTSSQNIEYTTPPPRRPAEGHPTGRA